MTNGKVTIPIVRKRKKRLLLTETTTDQTAKATETLATAEATPEALVPEKTDSNKDASEKKVVPKAVIEVVKAEMQRLCEVILEAEAKRAELAAFIVEAE